MKKYRLLKLVSAFALLGAGAFALAPKKAEGASATGNKRIYIDFNGVGFQGNARIHYWGGATGSSWPGVALNTTTNKIDKSSIVFSNRETCDRDFYYWDIPSDSTKADILNSDGSSVWNRWNEFSVPSFNLFQPSDWGVGGGDETAGVNFTSWNMVKVTLNKANSTTLTEYHIPAWSTENGYSAPAPTSGYRWVDKSTSNEFVNGTNLSEDTVLEEELIPATTYTVTFYNGAEVYDTVVVNEGGTAVCSKADPTKATVGSVCYKFAGWTDDQGDPISLSNVKNDLNVYASFNADRIAGRYIIGHVSWNMSEAAYMTYDSVKSEYTATINLNYGDEFKIVYYDGSDIQWSGSLDAYEALTPSADAFKYFGPGNGSEGNHNFKCYARGTYSFYFTDGNYDTSYKSSVALESSKNAEHLAALLMGAGNTPGQCESLFAGMRTIYLGLSSEEKAAFAAYGELPDTEENAQFLGAYRRYVAWAAALGEDPWSEAKASSSPFAYSNMNTKESRSLIIIVSVVSLISASTLVGLIVIKKRRATH